MRLSCHKSNLSSITSIFDSLFLHFVTSSRKLWFENFRMLKEISEKIEMFISIMFNTQVSLIIMKIELKKFQKSLFIKIKQMQCNIKKCGYNSLFSFIRMWKIHKLIERRFVACLFCPYTRKKLMFSRLHIRSSHLVSFLSFRFVFFAE